MSHRGGRGVLRPGLARATPVFRAKYEAGKRAGAAEIYRRRSKQPRGSRPASGDPPVNRLRMGNVEREALGPPLDARRRLGLARHMRPQTGSCSRGIRRTPRVVLKAFRPRGAGAVGVVSLQHSARDFDRPQRLVVDRQLHSEERVIRLLHHAHERPFAVRLGAQRADLDEPTIPRHEVVARARLRWRRVEHRRSARRALPQCPRPAVASALRQVG